MVRYNGQRRFGQHATMIALMLAAALSGSVQAHADTGIHVVMNQATVLKLARPADTVVVGDPEIADAVVKDSNGQVLQDGDAVVLIKDLKVKGSSTVLKMGTKVKSIRLVGGDHEVDCKMDGGSFMLKACFLKKA